jgi:hypothetical protein
MADWIALMLTDGDVPGSVLDPETGIRPGIFCGPSQSLHVNVRFLLQITSQNRTIFCHFDSLVTNDNATRRRMVWVIGNVVKEK